MNITIWRHVVVAASRRHLKSGQFKRDYDIVQNHANYQTVYTSLVAGDVYSRFLEEAPGHIASARQQYQTVAQAMKPFHRLIKWTLH